MKETKFTILSFTSNQARRRAPSKCSDVTSVMCQIIARFDSLVDAKRRRRARLVDRKAIKVISHLVAILISVSNSNASMSLCFKNGALFMNQRVLKQPIFV